MNQRTFARLYDPVTARYEAWLAPRKEKLLADLAEPIFEIGPGTGANFPFLPAGCDWRGVEPNPHMHEFLRRKARRAGIEATLLEGNAQRLPAEDGSMATVLSTLVLCSVGDPAAALAEARRVLRPGGRFVFIEHVAAEPWTWRRIAQFAARPIWRWCADGCRTDCNTFKYIQQAGFDHIEHEQFMAPCPPSVPIVAPHIAGAAWKEG